MSKNNPTEKELETLVKILEAAKRDLSVDNGELPEGEVAECLSMIALMEKEISEVQSEYSKTN